MSGVNNVNVSVEVPLENLVHEITYDGVEILQTPLTMSENLTRLAQKIEFTAKDDEPVEETTEEGKETEEENADGTFKTTPAWPWESVRNKLRATLTELSVLSDIISISKEKKYLVLDPVQAEPTDPKPAATLIYKKKSLAAAASVLMTGCERLRSSLNEAKPKTSMTSPITDFHMELLRLRQNWRLRKVGNAILGDLSYRTAGSRFPQQGIFEVSKAEDEPKGSDGLDDPSSSSTTGSSTSGSVASTSGTSSADGKQTSLVRVTVPKELQGIAYIQVLIQKDQDILSLANIGLLGPAPTAVDAHWQHSLEAAQNVLFCRELFSVLAREAVTLSSMSIPPLVVGNRITATLFPGISLIIGLYHGNSAKDGPNAVHSKLDHNHVLEHSLHQLLRENHRQTSCVPIPHPATAPIGISKKRRLAGPLAYDRYTLLQMTKKEGILEEMIRQAQHVVLRLKAMYVIDTLAKEIKDPLVVAHWASLNAVTHSCVRLTLYSSGYDMTSRTPLVIHVKEKSLKCILKDGKAIHLSYEPQELRDIILSQIAIHQVMALQSLSKNLGWPVLSSSAHLGVGTCENLGNAAGCLLSSPNGKRLLAVRSSPQTWSFSPKQQLGQQLPQQQQPQGHHGGLQVFVGYPPGAAIDLANKDKPGSSKSSNTRQQQQFISNGTSTPMDVDGSRTTTRHPFDLDAFDTDEAFESTTGIEYKPIRLDKLEGKNFLNKMEMLMAVLASA